MLKLAKVPRYVVLIAMQLCRKWGKGGGSQHDDETCSTHGHVHALTSIN